MMQSQFMWLSTEQYATQTPALRHVLPHLHDVLDRSLFDPDLIWNSEIAALLYDFAGAPPSGSWHWRAYLRTHPTALVPVDLMGTAMEPAVYGSVVMLLRRVRIELPGRIVNEPGHVSMLMMNRAQPPAIAEDAMELDSPRPLPPLLGPQDIVRRLSTTNRVWQVQDTPTLVHVKFGAQHTSSDHILLKPMAAGAVALIFPLFMAPTGDWNLKMGREFKLSNRPVPNPEQVEFFREWATAAQHRDYLSYRVAKVRIGQSPTRRDAVTAPSRTPALRRSVTPPRRKFRAEDSMSISSPSYISPSPPQLSRSSPSLPSLSSPLRLSPNSEADSGGSLLASAGEIQAEIQQRYPTLDPSASLLKHMKNPRMLFTKMAEHRYRCTYAGNTSAHFIGPCPWPGDEGVYFYFLILNKSVPHIIKQVWHHPLNMPEQHLQQSLHKSTLPPGWMAMPSDPSHDHSVLMEMMSAPPNELGRYLTQHYGENCGWGLEAMLTPPPPQRY